MLFNLSQQRHFPNKGIKKQIECGPTLGPCFTGGDGNHDLSARLEPFNGIKKCLSRPKKIGYDIPIDP
jgi:hypothetical protein